MGIRNYDTYLNQVVDTKTIIVYNHQFMILITVMITLANVGSIVISSSFVRTIFYPTNKVLTFPNNAVTGLYVFTYPFNFQVAS